MFRCSANETKATFDNLIQLASSGPTGKYPKGPSHIIAPGYVHDVEYVHHYTGIRPLYLPYSLLGALDQVLGEHCIVVTTEIIYGTVKAFQCLMN